MRLALPVRPQRVAQGSAGQPVAKRRVVSSKARSAYPKIRPEMLNCLHYPIALILLRLQRVLPSLLGLSYTDRAAHEHRSSFRRL